MQVIIHILVYNPIIKAIFKIYQTNIPYDNVQYPLIWIMIITIVSFMHKQS